MENNIVDEKTLMELSMDIGSWVPMQEIPLKYPRFTYATLKTMFWKRSERPGLERCSRMIGKQLFICEPLFGLWLGGHLPEQHVLKD